MAGERSHAPSPPQTFGFRLSSGGGRGVDRMAGKQPEPAPVLRGLGEQGLKCGARGAGPSDMCGSPAADHGPVILERCVGGVAWSVSMAVVVVQTDEW